MRRTEAAVTLNNSSPTTRRKQTFSNTICSLCKISNSSLKVWAKWDSLPPCVHTVKLSELFYTLQHCLDVCSVREKLTALCQFIHLFRYEKAMMSWSLRRKLQDGRLTLFLDKIFKKLSQLLLEIMVWDWRINWQIHQMHHQLKVSNISYKIHQFLVTFLMRFFLSFSRSANIQDQKKLLHILQHRKCEMTDTTYQWFLHQQMIKPKSVTWTKKVECWNS